MIRVRVDDYPFNKPEERWRHNQNSFREFNRILRNHTGCRYLIGIIPKKCSPEDLLMIRNETDCVVGMHGIEHDEGKLNIYQNEFEPWLSKYTIMERLVESRLALEDVLDQEIRVYMPPRNQIDRRTQEAARLAGFWAFTSGPETPLEMRSGGPLAVYHSEPPHEYGRSDEMYRAGSHRILSEMQDDVILTLHWTWEVNIGLDNLNGFLSQIPKDRFINFDP